MLRSNIHFNQLPRRSRCCCATSISSNFLDALDATLVTSIWINFEDALDASLQHNIHVKQLQNAVGATFQHPLSIAINFPDAVDATL